ncbi:MAG: hypothetical protein ISEC1_P1690 [Thiomicrorhabdus sp.]|nr:MAG: hypothetical protein ISEC1_P1690 [Thiomicrorhabdus sp.]
MPLTAEELKQKQLAQHCYWDESEQTLWIDCRKLVHELGVVEVPSWDALTMSSIAIPNYPSQLKVLAWSNYSQISYWRKQIPQWVQDSCALFPTHQLKLLHYAGKYPQVLELLDHAPMLAWRLMATSLEEPEIVALMSGKRQDIVTQVGWPGKHETVKFLRNLRLRMVNEKIAEQVEICLMDDKRLTALQSLPRINSMALSLAAYFPELIGSGLHLALAQLPCRPMQCQSMVALLEDAYTLAEWLKLETIEVDKIGHCRYLVEVTDLYQKWLAMGPKVFAMKNAGSIKEIIETSYLALKLRLSSELTVLNDWQDWIRLSNLQEHAWWTSEMLEEHSLLAWQDADGLWGVLIQTQPKDDLSAAHKIIRVRGEENVLPGAKQLSDLHLWLANSLPKSD